MIFLTEYAESASSGPRSCARAAGPYGHRAAQHRRVAAARPSPAAPAVADCTAERPLRLLYLSTIAPYKHPLAVVHAVASLRARGLPLALELVGGHDHPRRCAICGQRSALWTPTGRFLVYAGSVEHRLVAEKLHAADVFVFASSCENMPNILLEAMAAGLPIACADRGPMPEVLGAGGVYLIPSARRPSPTRSNAW